MNRKLIVKLNSVACNDVIKLLAMQYRIKGFKAFVQLLVILLC